MHLYVNIYNKTFPAVFYIHDMYILCMLYTAKCTQYTGRQRADFMTLNSIDEFSELLFFFFF